jgi:hypothetical protein
MQGPQRKTPAAVLFDSSLDESIDQILALAMVLAYTGRQDARLGSISVSRNSLAVLSFCELMVRFYRGEQPGEAPGRGAVTIGMSEDGSAAAASPMVSAVLGRPGANNRPLYARTIGKLNETADPVATIRNVLSAQQDQSAVVVLAGPPLNLLGLLAIPEGKALIGKKVRGLTIGAPLSDVAGFTRLLAEWPGPITIAGEDVRNIPFPAAAIEEDFAATSNHPLADAYRAAGPMPYDAPIGAMAAVLQAVQPDGSPFALSNAGTLTVSGGRAQFAEGGQGRHRIMSAEESKRGQIAQTLRQVVAPKPAEPRRGGRGD